MKHVINAGRRSGAAGLLLLFGLVPTAAPVLAAPAGGGKIWAVQGRHTDGRPLGRVIYHLVLNAGAVYVTGVGQNHGILEKYSAHDGSFLWEREQALGAREGMHIAFDTDFMYVVCTPWSLEKRLPACGSLVWRQAGDGGKPYTIAILDEALFMAGTDGNNWKFEKRALEDGALIWRTNGVSGRILTSAIAEDGLYLGGYENADDSARWRLEKRALDDGRLLWTQTDNFSDGADKLYGLAVRDGDVFAAGYDSAPDAGQWRIQRRRGEDGALVWERTVNPSPGMDKAHGLAVDQTGLYIPGYQDGNQWRIERRALADGALVWEVLGPSGGRLWYGVDLDETGLYVGGHIDGGWRIEKHAK